MEKYYANAEKIFKDAERIEDVEEREKTVLHALKENYNESIVELYQEIKRCVEYTCAMARLTYKEYQTAIFTHSDGAVETLVISAEKMAENEAAYKRDTGHDLAYLVGRILPPQTAPETATTVTEPTLDDALRLIPEIKSDLNLYAPLINFALRLMRDTLNNFDEEEREAAVDVDNAC